MVHCQVASRSFERNLSISGISDQVTDRPLISTERLGLTPALASS
ncbi:hypothetical protein SynSYN20_02281 [Synechococcus sp. SYN20]|nr:hypothetical protein SynSYN20_02281 [Synechococcus sp. SYN20]